MILIGIYLKRLKTFKLGTTYKTVYTCSTKEERVLQRNVSSAASRCYFRQTLVQKIAKRRMLFINNASMIHMNNCFVHKVNAYKRADTNKLNICLNG